MKKRRNRSIQSAAIRTVFGLILVSSVLLASCTGIADPTETPTAAPTETPTAAPTETPTEAPTEPQPTEEDHDYPTDGRFYLKPGMKVVDVDPEVVLKVFQETALAYYYKNPYAQYNTRTGQTALGENGSWFMT
ncbi:MAG: hypothetical protein IKY02_05565, partial [Lachnospiraceae bacterium]|nr:hypothetical protein [Lachnospiraceae bacterium]